jgi:hypothetical protein
MALDSSVPQWQSTNLDLENVRMLKCATERTGTLCISGSLHRVRAAPMLGIMLGTAGSQVTHLVPKITVLKRLLKLFLHSLWI